MRGPDNTSLCASAVYLLRVYVVATCFLPLPSHCVCACPNSLCGFPPFYDENTSVMFAHIKAGDFDFPSPEWDEVSPDGA